VSPGDPGRAVESLPGRPAVDGPTVALLCALLALLPGSAAQAQRLLFQPEIFAGASYTDNALLVGDEDNETAIFRLGAVLPVTKTYPGGRFHFSYSPVYERFRDFEELDNLSHRAALAWSTKPSERSSFGLRTRYARFQDDRTSVPTRLPLFLREPVTRELAALDLSFGRRIARSWDWKGGVGYSIWSFEPVEETASTVTLEDREEARAQLGLRRILKPGFFVGGEYAVRRFDLDVTGEETAHLLSLTIDRTIKDRLRLAFGVGGFVTEGDSEDDERGAQGWLTMSRTFLAHTLSLTATHRPSAGGSRLGTSELSTAALGVDGNVGDVWLWGLFGRYARRQPNLPEEVEIETVGTDGYVERKFRKVVGLRLGVGYAEQTADDPAQEGDVYRTNVSLIVYPLGGTRLGGDEPEALPEPPDDAIEGGRALD